MYDEEVEHNLKPDSLKKKFRAVVEELVVKGLVKQLAEKEFELPTP
jgi:hypothetical protein